MNREQTKEAIKVMQHYADGGEVNWRPRGKGDWEACGYDPVFDFLRNEYRIKPKPLECWVIDINGSVGVAWESRNQAEQYSAGNARIVHMVESPE